MSTMSTSSTLQNHNPRSSLSSHTSYQNPQAFLLSRLDRLATILGSSSLSLSALVALNRCIDNADAVLEQVQDLSIQHRCDLSSSSIKRGVVSRHKPSTAKSSHETYSPTSVTRPEWYQGIPTSSHADLSKTELARTDDTHDSSASEREPVEKPLDTFAERISHLASQLRMRQEENRVST